MLGGYWKHKSGYRGRRRNRERKVVSIPWYVDCLSTPADSSSITRTFCPLDSSRYFFSSLTRLVLPEHGNPVKITRGILTDSIWFKKRSRTHSRPPCWDLTRALSFSVMFTQGSLSQPRVIFLSIISFFTRNAFQLWCNVFPFQIMCHSLEYHFFLY